MNNKFDESGINIKKNTDGSFEFEWDPQDKRWSWMNSLTNEQVQIIIQGAINDYINDLRL